MLEGRTAVLRKRIRFCKRYGYSYFRMSRFIGVEGWLSPKEAMLLYDFVMQIENEEPVVVEIGSWLGRSATVIGTALKNKAKRSGKKGILYCVDPFNGFTSNTKAKKNFDRILSGYQDTVFNVFLSNMKKSRLTDVIHPLQGFSQVMLSSWDRPIDMAFIDGDHTYERVKEDFELLQGHIKIGGLICFHDVYKRDGTYSGDPGEFVRNEIESNPNWKIVAQAHSILAIRKVL